MLKYYLEKFVYFLPVGFDVCVAFVDSVLPVIEHQKHVVFVFFPLEQWCLGPCGHDLLDLFDVIFGLLHSGF